MTEEIEFNHYYNKLRYSLFTALKPFTWSKFRHYSRNIGKVFNVTVKGESSGKAKLLIALEYKPLNTHKDFIDFNTEGKWKVRTMRQYILLVFKKEKQK